MIPQDIHNLLMDYREAAIGTEEANATKQKASADRVHVCYKLLREHQEGQQGLVALMTDRHPQVQLWAASHCLGWSPQKAKQVLEALRDSSDFPTSFTARITLQKFEKGSLSFDY